MKRFVIFLLLVCSTFLVKAGDKKETNEILKQGNTRGKDFLIAIPPNEAENSGIVGISLDIYVTSNVDTKATLSLPSGKIITKDIKALSVTTFSSSLNDFSFINELYSSGEVGSGYTFRITSNDSIGVYVLNNKDKSADGYLALPRDAWGKKYIHVGYYDQVSTDGWNSLDRSSGFIVIADTDNVDVKIKLRGVGLASVKTRNGYKIGDSISVKLNRNEIYVVKTYGTQSGTFDITGSEITANKNIGLISFHERTTIPIRKNESGANCLNEMMTPVDTWGKKYTTTEFKRKGKGDFFRIVASEDNTKWSVVSYDDGGMVLHTKSGVLAKAGNFWENLIGKDTIAGNSVWIADKPVLLMQYSYSATYDNDNDLDPFMTLVVPEDQYVKYAVFQTPQGVSSFKNNYLNILAIGDSTDKNNTKLKSVIIDGVELYKIDPDFVKSRIPNTNLYKSTLSSTEGAHYLSSTLTKFGGYIYGFDNHNGYGWPAAMSVIKLNIDTLAPRFQVGDYCDSIDVVLNDDLVGSDIQGEETIQEDRGIVAVNIEKSTNLELLNPKALIFNPDSASKRVVLKFKLIDRTQIGELKLTPVDKAGNSKSYEYIIPNPAKPRLSLEFFGFEKNSGINPGTKRAFPLLIRGNNINKVNIKEFKIEFLYEKAHFSYTYPSIIAAAYKTKWSVVCKDTVVDATFNKLTLSFIGQDSLVLNKVFAYLYLDVLLSKDSVYKMTPKLIFNNADNVCELPKVLGDFNVEFCIQNLRQVKFGSEFQAIRISPNPISGDEVKFDFTNSFECQVNVELINSFGQTVKIIRNENLSAGDYREQFNVAELSSGVYYIKMNAGPFTDIQKVLISK